MPQQPAGTTTRIDRAVSVLKSRHERVTPARLAVLKVLNDTDQHLNAEEVIALAAERAPSVHRATVYRALSTLGEIGLVAHTHLGGAATVYHLSDPAHEGGGSDRHAHLQCTSCGAIIDIPADTMKSLQSQLHDHYQFQLDPGHTALLGTCAQCAPAPPS